MNQPTQYFVETDMGRAYAYYRERYQNNCLYEEIWQQKNRSWKHIPLRLIWMQISGECTLASVSYEQLRLLIPEAFEDKEGKNETTYSFEQLKSNYQM